MEAIEQALRFRPRLAFEALGQQRSRRGGNGAAGSLKSDVGDPVGFEFELDCPGVAAQRVVALRLAARAWNRSRVARTLAVIDHDLLIQILEAPHHRKTSLTFSIPSTSASISSRVLQKARAARVVAGTPN